MVFLRWLFDANDLRGPLSVRQFMDHIISAEASVMFAEVWNSWCFDVGKFALEEVISQHVLVDLLSVYGISRTRASISHQSVSFNHHLLAGRSHLP